MCVARSPPPCCPLSLPAHCEHGLRARELRAVVRHVGGEHHVGDHCQDLEGWEGVDGCVCGQGLGAAIQMRGCGARCAEAQARTSSAAAGAKPCSTPLSRMRPHPTAACIASLVTNFLKSALWALA